MLYVKVPASAEKVESEEHQESCESKEKLKEEKQEEGEKAEPSPEPLVKGESLCGTEECNPQVQTPFWAAFGTFVRAGTLTRDIDVCWRNSSAKVTQTLEHDRDSLRYAIAPDRLSLWYEALALASCLGLSLLQTTVENLDVTVSCRNSWKKVFLLNFQFVV